jgi:hypothetical protein
MARAAIIVKWIYVTCSAAVTPRKTALFLDPGQRILGAPAS